MPAIRLSATHAVSDPIAGDVPILYFAYGSNMAASVMERACPGHRCLGRASLPGYRVAFTRRSVRSGTGVADIVPSEAGEVWGMVYELDTAHLDTLDRKEGNGWAYRREPLRVRASHDGAEHDALAYRVISPRADEVAPSAQYLHDLLDAARARELPDAYVASLLAPWSSIETAQPDRADDPGESGALAP